ncbi:MAG: hypothetical protein WCJ10_06760, partial [Opitutaceae bacterium]
EACATSERNRLRVYLNRSSDGERLYSSGRHMRCERVDPTVGASLLATSPRSRERARSHEVVADVTIGE